MNGAPILAATGRIAEAIEAGERAVTHFERDSDRANHAKSVANLGEVLLASGAGHQDRARRQGRGFQAGSP